MLNARLHVRVINFRIIIIIIIIVIIIIGAKPLKPVTVTFPAAEGNADHYQIALLG